MATYRHITAHDVHARAFSLLRTCLTTLLLAACAGSFVYMLIGMLVSRLPMLVVLVVYMLSGLLMTGLYQGLLTALRGGECTPRTLLAGFSQWGRVLALEGALLLRCLGWMLLLLLPTTFLSVLLAEALALPEDALVYPALIVVLFALFCITMRYMYAMVHLADLKSRIVTASDCIRASVADVRAVGFWRTLWIHWPLLLGYALQVGLNSSLAHLSPAMESMCDVLSNLLSLAYTSLGPALLVSLYAAIPRTGAEKA